MDDAFKEVIRLGGLETESDYSYDGRVEEVMLSHCGLFGQNSQFEWLSLALECKT